MTAKWSLIIKAYKKARGFLWDNMPDAAFQKNQELGRIYLYEAYHDALKEEYKEHLWYARILFMMYEYHRGRCSEQLLFHRYLNEAYHEYILAAAENDVPERAEMAQIEAAYNKAKRYVEMQSTHRSRHDELNRMIGGIVLPEDFIFQGSRIVYFQHDIVSAKLKLESRGMTALFRFTDVYEIRADISFSSVWASDIVCRKFPDSKAIYFDIGAYKILCEGIELVGIDNSHFIGYNYVKNLSERVEQY